MSKHPLFVHAKTVNESHDKNIRRGTYQDRGRAIGAGLGATAGLASGLTAKHLLKARGLKGARGTAIMTGLGAAGGALAGEVAGTLIRRKQPLKETKNYSAMITTASLVQFSAHLDQKLEAAGVSIDFRSQEPEKPSAAKRAAAVAGAGALAAGGLYARGRLARNGGKWGSTKAPGRFPSDVSGPTVGQTVWSDLKRGTGMTVNDIKRPFAAAAEKLRERQRVRSQGPHAAKLALPA